MSYTTTTRLGLKKAVPGSNQPFETAVINTNWDSIDADLVSAASRLTAIESLNTSEESRLTAIETLNSTQTTRLDGHDASITSLSSRVTTTETYGPRLTAVEALDVTQNSRLTTLEYGIDGGSA